MKQRLLRTLFFGSLLIGFTFTLGACGIALASPDTTVYLEPETSAWLPSTVFNITVSIADVSELYGWQFNLTFNPAVLEALEFYEGPFLKQAALAQGGDTYELPTTLNNTAGWVFAGRAFSTPLDQGASGSGILAYVTFNATAEGTSSLEFYAPGTDTFLNTMNPDTQLPERISFTPVGGSVNVALVHDVAVTGLTVSESRVTVGANVSVVVNVKNNGSVAETFDVTLSYDSTVIKIQTVSGLAPGDSESLSFTWNTKELATQDYTITATASTVSGETQTSNNADSVVVSVVSPAPIVPMEVLVAVIVVIVVVGAIAFFYVKRRSKK
ncbi:MAG TPA: cohesin domain-containing protein [Candidatus Bathyarchaeia archaeon]|nr:cohesin domain-containing protein [Candidatus Bathyarchaeia archaeon]